MKRFQTSPVRRFPVATLRKGSVASSLFTICCCGLVSLAAISCQTRPVAPVIVKRSQPLLGAFVTISVCGTPGEQLDKAISEAFNEFRRVDQILSIHRTDSEL